MEKNIPLWLDVDPVCHQARVALTMVSILMRCKGHDDATAILLAIHLDNIDLLGVSTVSPLTQAHLAPSPRDDHNRFTETPPSTGLRLTRPGASTHLQRLHISRCTLVQQDHCREAPRNTVPRSMAKTGSRALLDSPLQRVLKYKHALHATTTANPSLPCRA